MGLGPRMLALSSNLINKYGADAVITRAVGGNFNPVTQMTSGGTSKKDTLKVVVEDYRAYEVNGDTVRYGDKKILVPKSDLTNLSYPVPNDTIEVLSTTYRIISVDGVSSGDDIIAYSVQARK